MNISSSLPHSQTPNSEALTAQAELYYAQGHLSEAIACCRQSLNLQPNWASTYVTLANIIQAQGKISEAINLYYRAIELNPELSQAHVNLGSMFFRQGKLDEAIAYYRKAIQLRPDMAVAYWNLAKVWQQLGKLDEAIASEEKALKLNPNLGGFEVNLSQGYKLAEEGKLDEAIDSWQKAITLNPNLAEAYSQIGIIFRSQGKFSEAIKYLKKAIEVQPNYATAHQHLCGILRDGNNYVVAREAVTNYYQECGEIDPIMTGIYLISTYQISGLNEIAKDRFFDLEAKLKEDMTIVKKVVDIKALYGNFLFSVPYLRDNIQVNSDLYRSVSKIYTQFVLKPQNNHFSTPVNFDNKHLLKFGFISSHFNRHSIGWCSLDIIRELGKLNTEIYLYPTERLKADDQTQKFSQAVTKLYVPKKYPQGSVDVREIITEIQQDKIDILIDLDSLSLPINTEILYHKPAPVCISWLGFDAPYISENNYFLCDSYTHPQDRDKYYIEKLVRMPNSFVATSGFQRIETNRANLRKSQRIGLDQIVYLCLAPGRKFNRDLVKAQIAILKQVPNSILIHKALGDIEVFQSAYHQACKAEGVSIHRIKFIERFPTEEEHRSIYSLADIMLDSYPYNGGTHTLEALWFNLPVITLAGEQFLSRMGYSFLQSLDIKFGVAWSWNEYIDWGVKLGQNPHLRQEFVDKLVKSKELENLAPLWNPKKFAQDMYNTIGKL
ncbi:MAG: tetratricopeptide repeat protein [Okeania sp. SIO2G4]|uniref:tetratricopeptide repeat protein n=1 Tax=unclassified Okeania TaxID=2634635 RepID=UPI0013B84D59|nr:MULTISPECIES: tetratricopeptide repeat protein [unclassified Okeania]NEP71856.1 tetratricopeptide repeat protein [Okeania sp. SIO2G5]NEP92876.1 tetratricopeptide repeat protein [Okeania sp. SIO2F5]NEQ90952.1 tetratricopeptide repeat protein [Okeania sp. SIO2G4]